MVWSGGMAWADATEWMDGIDCGATEVSTTTWVDHE
jgi:hypothetical protein